MKSKFTVRILSLAMILLLLSKGDLLAQQSLVISDGTGFVSKACYPKFSWETTPMYYMFGDTKRLLTDDEVQFIADRTDYICIEKSHGLDVLGGAELGAKHEASAFKKIKPGIKVLFYFNSAWAWPFTSYSKTLTPKTVNDNPELKSYLLVNPETGELHFRETYIHFTYAYDVLNPDFRKWWVETVAKGVKESGCDGAFIDQMHGFSYLRADKQEDVRKAQGELIAALKKKLGPDKIVLGNNAHQDNAKYVFPSVDAMMFEHYKNDLLSKEGLLKDWKNMLRIAQAGKMSVFRIGIEADKSQQELSADEKNADGKEARMAQLSKERVEYYLACFLIGAQPYSYFQYGWGWDLSDGSLYDYPDLQKPLGAPKGAYTRTSPEGWEFTRDFEHASVWLDTEKELAKITWK